MNKTQTMSKLWLGVSMTKMHSLTKAQILSSFSKIFMTGQILDCMSYTIFWLVKGQCFLAAAEALEMTFLTA